MAVGRHSIDPTWMEEGEPATVPTTPPAAVPAASVTSQPSPSPTAQANSVEAARAVVDQQANHDELKPQPTPARPDALPSSVPTPTSAPVAATPPVKLGPLRATPAQPPSSPIPHIPRQDQSQPLPPPRFHLPGYASALAWLVGVVVLLSGGFLASEAGWISLGVEQFWGLSNNAPRALSSSAQALAATQQYRVDGTLELSFPQATALPTLSPRGLALYQSLAAASGQARVLGVRTAQEAGPPSQSVPATASVQLRHSIQGTDSQLESSWTVSSNISSKLLGARFSQGGMVRIDAVTSSEQLFVRLPSPLGEEHSTWAQSALSELSAFALQPLRWSALLESMATRGTGKRLPGKTVNGVKTKGYELQVPAGALAATTIPNATNLPGTVTVQVWLGTKDQRPYLLTVNGAVGSGTLTGQLLFAQYDQVQPIELPDPSTVASVSLSDWLEREGVVRVDSPASRDAGRAADLDRIKQALGEYATAQTPFTYPVTEGVVRLDQAAEVATTLQPYLDPLPDGRQALPADPLSPEHYYGYRSDGVSYRLTAVAEDPATPNVVEENGLKLLVRSN